MSDQPRDIRDNPEDAGRPPESPTEPSVEGGPATIPFNTLQESLADPTPRCCGEQPPDEDEFSLSFRECNRG